MKPSAERTPANLAAAIALVSASLLMLEIVLSRIFSVLFFYHYSFFAVGLVMSGLTFGGLAAARWRVGEWDDEDFGRRLAALSGGGAVAQLVGLGLLILVMPPTDDPTPPRMGFVVLAASVFLPALTLAGTFLAVVLSRRREWVGRLYAADLAGAAVGCLAAVGVMRVLAGPVCIVVSALLSAVVPLLVRGERGGRASLRLAPLALVLLVLVAQWGSGDRLVRLKSNNEPVIERWSEHSRLWVTSTSQGFFEILIDRAAGTFMPILGTRNLSAPFTPNPGWLGLVSSFPYLMERPLSESAIIGVGGGRDLLPPLAVGARHVDGFEINHSMVRLLTHDLKEFNNIADWPEVSLQHSEGRIGIRHSGRRYDSIQASQIDTWAATAAGGFVLSENGLYTLEAWRLFLSRLTDRGWLSMTRWYLPDAPAETHRLVALAVEALRDAGIENPAAHIVLVVHGSTEEIQTRMRREGILSTIVVSRAPFSPVEVANYLEVCGENRWTMLVPALSGVADPEIEGLLNSETRERTIHEHRYDIAAPTDDRPFFFLLMRPGDFFKVPDTDAPAVVENTMNAVRVMVALLILSAAFALGVWGVVNRWFPRDELDAAGRGRYRWLTAYFVGIGAGYMFVQLAFHQRLILALGLPTYSLSVILFSMLMGGGVGSMLSGALRGGARSAGVCLIPVFICGLWLAAPLFSRLEEIPSELIRVGLCSAIVGTTGVVLGLAFPLGAGAAAGLGGWAVQRMWAINGAASILGSSSAALLGMILGGRAMFAAGAAFYVLTAVAGWFAFRRDPAAGMELPPSTP